MVIFLKKNINNKMYLFDIGDLFNLEYLYLKY